MKQNDLIKLRIAKLNKQTKDGKRKWVEYRTKMNLVVKGEEESGKQEKWVTVKFYQVDTTAITGRGMLTVKVADISFPHVYEIKTKDDGTLEYPVVWVRDYKEFAPIESEIENPFITDEFDESEDSEFGEE